MTTGNAIPAHQREWLAAFESVLELWCWHWAKPALAHSRAEFCSWMQSCDTADSRALDAHAAFVGTALLRAQEGRWDRDPDRRAYVMVREQFYGYAAAAYARRFPIQGPVLPEVDDVPF